MTHRILIIALCLSAFAGIAADKIQPGKLDIDPPTLIGLGFEWWVSGDDNKDAQLTVQYRKEGAQEWLPGLAPVYHPRGNAASMGWREVVDSHFAGSVIDLEKDTAYEVRLTLTDPNGVTGEAEQIFTARTRRVPEAAEGGRRIEVSADGSKGEKLEDVLTKLQPGDTVLLHAGIYAPPPFQAPPSPAKTGGDKVHPGEGRVLHVYPPRYKGKKEKPNFRNLMEAYHGGRWEWDVQFYDLPEAVQPGDTIVLHAGKYETQQFNYRYALALWQHGTYRFTREGTAEQPITIKAAGDGPVVLDGGGAYRMFDLLQAKHHVFDGLTLENAFIALDVGAAEKQMQGKGIVIQDCAIRSVRRGIVGSEGSDIRIIDTSIEEGAFEDRQEGTYTVVADGTAEQPITFKPAGDGAVVIDGGDNFLLFDVMNADHLIFEDLTFRNTFTAIHAGRRGPGSGSTGITVKSCRFEEIQNGVFGLNGACRSFTILDNVFLGRLSGNNPGGYAVNLSGAGHAVGYNYSNGFWDHLNVQASSTSIEGYRAFNIDFYNNICIRGRDNIFEVDGTMWNTRFLRNKCVYSAGGAWSSQPTIIGPAYYIRNLLYLKNGFKFVGSTGGIRAFHNTIIGKGGKGPEEHLINNLIIEESGGTVGFDAFKNVPQPEDWLYFPSDDSGPVDVRKLDFSLVEGSAAIDAGQVIPGFDYIGDAPDLGALETGKPVPHYGPRTQKIYK